MLKFVKCSVSGRIEWAPKVLQSLVASAIKTEQLGEWFTIEEEL